MKIPYYLISDHSVLAVVFAEEGLTAEAVTTKAIASQVVCKAENNCNECAYRRRQLETATVVVAVKS